MRKIFYIITVYNLALHKPAWQHSTVYGAVASRAVDGNPEPHFPFGTCTHTNGHTYPTWGVDLQIMSLVYYVEIMRRDLAEHGMHLSKFTNWQIILYKSTVQCRYNAVNCHPNPHKIHPIARPQGRCVVVFCEYKLCMRTRLLCMNKWFNRLPYDVIQHDEGVLCMYFFFICTIKKQQLVVWIQKMGKQLSKNISLASRNMYTLFHFTDFFSYWINRISSASFMDDFYVVGSNLSFPSSLPGPMRGNGYHLCGQYPGTPPVGQISRITCQPQPITARYVYIQCERPRNPRVLELCEVWVYASKLTALYLRIDIITSITQSLITQSIPLLRVNVEK